MQKRIKHLPFFKGEIFMEKLTEKEKTFAETHHNLVIQFLHSKRLDDDYYDVIVFGYLKAVSAYVNHLDLQKKYPFIIIAYRKMKDELIDHYIYTDRQKRAGEKIALRYSNLSEIKEPYNNYLEEYIIHRSIYFEIFSMLTSIEKKILTLKLKQYQKKEICEKCHIKENKLYWYMNAIKHKLGSEVYNMLLSS